MKHISELETKPGPQHNLHFSEAVQRWDEAIPLGSGLMGCLVWGDGSPLKFSLDRGDLWDKRVASEILDEHFKYEELIGLVKEGNQAEILRRFDDFYNKPTPTKIPAGRLELDFGDGIQSVQSVLSLKEAEGRIRLNRNGAYSDVKVICHAVEQTGYITINGSLAAPKVSIVAPNYTERLPDGDTFFSQSLGLLGYPSAKEYRDAEFIWFHQQTATELEYAVICAVRIISSIQTDIAFTVASNSDGQNWIENAKSKLISALDSGYSAFAVEHKQWWDNFWSDSRVDIPDALIEKQYYLANYLLGSCSRKGYPPMPLQGVWTADAGTIPPWKGDYHNDLNTQMSYWSYMKANHLPEGESFIDFLWNLADEGRRFARSFYDAPGLCLPGVMSIDGKPLGGWTQYCLPITANIWLCQAFDHYWLYTHDKSFLKDKGYPYLKESAECLLRWLEPGDDGKLVLPLSSSPEIFDNTINAWLTPNTNHELALMIWLFDALSKMADELGNGESEKWQDILADLSDLAVDPTTGAFMLSPDVKVFESHRHHAHAMSIYPLKLMNYDLPEDKAIVDATVTLLEQYGSGWWVGFSFAWMADLYAFQGNGEGAAYQLKLFWECCCSQNGFHLNGDFKKRGISLFHYRPFTLEANMCAADAVQEMLLQTSHGILKLFPAVPQEWSSRGVGFENLRCEGAWLVSSRMEAGCVKYVRITAQADGTTRLRADFGSESVRVEIAGVVQTTNLNQCREIEISLKCGQTCVLTPA